MSVQYYRDFDTQDIYAVPEDGNGIFRLPSNQLETGQWVYLEPNTLKWDSVHQTIFRQYDATPLDPATLAHPLPPLPPTPSAPARQWRDNFGPYADIPASSYPRLAELLASRESAAAEVFVVLREDRYESAFGDGCFRYFSSARLTEGDAKAETPSPATDAMTEYHLRRLTLQRSGETLGSPDFSPGPFDHYRLTDVLAHLERSLGG